MLTGVLRWSMARPRLMAGAGLVLFLLGVWFVRDIPVEIFPAQPPAQTVIQTQAPGLVAEQVEQLVTRPIENGLIGAPGVAMVRSQSIQGLSMITLDIAPGRAPAATRQAVSERLARLTGTLPAGVAAPQLAPLTAGADDLLTLGFTSARLDPMQLRSLVQWQVRPRLLSAAGVANVTVYGGQTRRVEVKARPGDLSDSDLGFLDVIAAARRATSVTGAGFMDTPEQRISIDPRGQALTPADVAAGQIQVVGNAPTRISDVADVVDAPAPALGDALIGGAPGVLVGVAAQYGAHTQASTQAVEQALAELRPALEAEGVTVITDINRPAGVITATIRSLALDLLIGAVLIALILFVVLRDPGAVFVAFASVLPALVAALAALKLMGLTLDAMTLGGLFVALGICIDDAVIDVESMAERLGLARPGHSARARAILVSAIEVRTPVVYATLVIEIALAPMLAVRGALGAFLAPLAITIIIASLASLVVALTLTPSLALLALGHARPASAISGRLKAAYGGWIENQGHRPGMAVLALGAAAALSVAMFLLFHGAALPSLHDGRLALQIKTPTSTSLTAMRRIGQSLSQAALSAPQVRQTVERIGRDPSDFIAAGPEQGELDLTLDPRLGVGEQERAAVDLRRRLAAFPDIQGQLRSGLDLAPGAPGGAAPFSVSVFGEDLNAVDQAAADIARVLRATAGAGEVTADIAPRAPSVRIDLNFKRLAIYGLSASDVLETIQTAFSGQTVAQIYDNGHAIDLAVAGPDSLRRDPEGIGKLLLRSSAGVSVPLALVARVYLTEGRAKIEHEAGQRRQLVTANPPPNEVERFARAARAAIQSHVALPAGVYLSFADSAAAARADRLRLLIACVVAAAAAVGLLVLVFQDSRPALLVLGSTAFAFVGGALVLTLEGGALTLGAVAGFVALFGLSSRNAILMLSRHHELAGRRETPWTLETVRDASVSRAQPILLTALLVAASVTPLLFAGAGGGAEILAPMAAVILGGLVSGAVLTLLFLPPLIFAYLPPRPSPAA